LRSRCSPLSLHDALPISSTRRSRGMSTPAMRATICPPCPFPVSLALLHLVLGVVTNDQHHALAADDLAPLTPRLDRCSYFHDLPHPLASGRRAVSRQSLPPTALPRRGRPTSAIMASARAAHNPPTCPI